VGSTLTFPEKVKTMGMPVGIADRWPSDGAHPSDGRLPARRRVRDTPLRARDAAAPSPPGSLRRVTEILALEGVAVDRYADVLFAVAAALVNDDVDLARVRLSPIAGERWFGSVKLAGVQQSDGVFKRVPIKERDRALTLIRDGFRCSACGGRAVPRGVLVALSDVFPNELPYQPHYKRGEIHPVYWALAAEADHVLPSSSGGSSELTNLRTIHAFCNTQRGNALLEDHERVAPAPAADDWDGLIAAYPQIVAFAAARGFGYSGSKYHTVRMRAFGIGD